MKKKRRMIAIGIAVILVGGICGGGYAIRQKQLSQDYKQAQEHLNESQYDEAIDLLQKIDGYKDSSKLLEEARKTKMIQEADNAFGEGRYEEAYKRYIELGMSEKADECLKKQAEAFVTDQQFEKARDIYLQLEDTENANACTLKAADSYLKSKDYEKAITLLESIEGYGEAKQKLNSARYNYAVNLYEENKFDQALKLFKSLKKYKESKQYAEKSRLGRKYEQIDFKDPNQFTLLEHDDVSGWPQEKIRKELEGILSELYITWHPLDNSGNLAISSDKMNGKEYGISKFCNVLTEDSMVTNIGYYFYENPQQKYEMSFGVDDSYFRIGEQVLTLKNNEQYYRSATTEQIAEFDRQLEDSLKSKKTVDEVYEFVQADVRKLFYTAANGGNDINSFNNLIDSVMFVSSATYDFESVDTIQYGFDQGTRMHTMIFNVTCSIMMGLGGSESYRFYAEYSEDDWGDLSQVALYPI